MKYTTNWCLALACSLSLVGNFTQAYAAQSKRAIAHNEKASDKQAAAKTETPITNVVNVTPMELVNHPNDYLNKNVKFTAKFFAFSSLALDYKPAFRSARTNLCFLILRPEAHVPLSELKLVMAIPKEKDPENQVLTALKDGEQIEVIGNVFATPLDEPWVDVLRLKRIPSEEKKDDKKISANTDEKKSVHETKAESVPLNHPAAKNKPEILPDVDVLKPGYQPSIQPPITK